MRCFWLDFPYFLQYYQTCSYVRLQPNGENPVASWPNSIPKHGAKIDSDPHTCAHIFSLASHLHAVSVWLMHRCENLCFKPLPTSFKTIRTENSESLNHVGVRILPVVHRTLTKRVWAASQIILPNTYLAAKPPNSKTGSAGKEQCWLGWQISQPTVY